MMMKTALELASDLIERVATAAIDPFDALDTIGEAAQWGIGYEGGRMREEAIASAIEKMAKKYKIENWEYHEPLIINSRGDIYIGVSQREAFNGNNLQIPAELVKKASAFAKPPGPHSHASANIIELNHFAMEKLLVSLGLLKIPESVREVKKQKELKRGTAFQQDKKVKDPFYAEQTEEGWCVFGSESGFCYSVLSGKKEAEKEANERNAELRKVRGSMESVDEVGKAELLSRFGKKKAAPFKDVPGKGKGESADDLIDRVVSGESADEVLGEETQQIEWIAIDLLNPAFNDNSIIDIYTIAKQEGLKTFMHDTRAKLGIASPGMSAIQLYVEQAVRGKNDRLRLFFNLDKITKQKAEAFASKVATSYDPTDF